MVEKLSPEGQRLIQIEALLNTIRKENMFVAREIVEGMQRTITRMQHDEDKERTLDTLKPDWNRYLN